MSDNTKQKKVIRARQEATGESYSTARMHVLRALPEAEAPATGLRAIAEATIRLAEAAAATHGASERRRLRDHLLGLSETDLRKIEVLMYAGRSDEGVRELALTLSRDSHEMTVNVVAGKTPVLAEYLREGLRVAADEGVDLDGPWTRKTPARWARSPGSDYDLAIDGMLSWDARVPVSRDEHAGEALRRKWAQREGVTETHGHVCLLRLAEGGCPVPGRSCKDLPGCDHSSLWIKDGTPHIYVTQPYELSTETLDSMFRMCHRFGLTLRVDTAPAWHDAGAVLIEVLREQRR